MASDKLSSAITGDLGVALARFKFGKLGLIFREKPTLDYGIDAEIEIVANERATGRLIAAQIKCGESYFREATDTHIVYRFSDDHFQYWIDHSLPVIVIVVDHEKELCFWAKVDSKEAKKTGKNYRLQIPKSQILDASAFEAISEIATPLVPGNWFRAVEQPPEQFGSVSVTIVAVKLENTEAAWTKADVEQVVRQATSGIRTEMLLNFRNQQSAGVDKREIQVLVSASDATDASKIVARADCTYVRGAEAQSAFWSWRFDWSEEFFQSETTEKSVSSAAEKYIARMSGPLMAMFFFLDWAEIQSRLYGGAYGKWLAAKVEPLIDAFSGLDNSPPTECLTWHRHLTEMVGCVKECQTLAASEDEWHYERNSFPPNYKHRSAGLVLLEAAVQHAYAANGELQRLSRLVSM